MTTSQFIKRDKVKCLLTDAIFPNKFSAWRNKEIKSFIKEFDTDILVNKIKSFAGIVFDFDWDFLNSEGLLNDYNILIFDKKFNYLNKYNKRIDGTQFNEKYKGSYLLTREKDFDLKRYAFVYHIFFILYQQFNNNFQFEKSKQFIHLYPGGGLLKLDDIEKIDPHVKIISTHPRITNHLEKIKNTNYVNAWTGSLMEKGETFIQKRKKSTGSPLRICFSSMGTPSAKGVALYHDLIKFYTTDFSQKNIKFLAIGNCEKINGLTRIDPLDYNSLFNFYTEYIDIYLNLETGRNFNGWPLGLESVISGCVLVTTDSNKDHDLYFEKNSGIFVIQGLSDLIKTIDFLYENQERLPEYSKKAQASLEKYLSYDNNQGKIFNYIKTKINYGIL